VDGAVLIVMSVRPSEGPPIVVAKRRRDDIERPNTGCSSMSRATTSKAATADYNQMPLTDSDSSECDWEDRLVSDRFFVREQVGGGSYAVCYRAIDRKAGKGEKEVCLKIEDTDEVRPKLHLEWDLLQMLATPLAAAEVPRTPVPIMYIDQGRYRIAAMQLLGESLDMLYNRAGRRLSLEVVASLGPQVIDCLEYVHARGLLHRDVKPANFLLGRGESEGRVLICDFGLSRRFLTPDRQHLPMRQGRGATGTARYMSVNAHTGTEQSRRDDVESVGHMLVFFLKGKLPWQRLRNGKWKDRKEKHRAFHEAKASVSVKQLCEGLPPAMEEFISYARGLAFTAQPDYQYLRRLLTSLAGGGVPRGISSGNAAGIAAGSQRRLLTPPSGAPAAAAEMGSGTPGTPESPQIQRTPGRAGSSEMQPVS